MLWYLKKFWDFATPKFSGGGGGGGTSSTSTQINYTPEEQADRQNVRTIAGNLLGSTPENQPYPVVAPAGLQPQTLAGQNYLMSTAAPGQANIAQGAAQATRFGLSDLIYGKDPTLSNAIDASVRPIVQSYTDPTGYLSQLRQEMVGNNMLGGTRDAIAQSVLGGRLATAVGDTAAKLANASRSDTLGTYAKVLGMVPQTMSALTTPGTTMSAVGEQLQSADQAQRDWQSDANSWALNYPWLRLQNYANMVYGGSSPGTTTQASMPTARTGIVPAALGGASMGMSLGSMFPALGGPAGAGIGALLAILGR